MGYRVLYKGLEVYCDTPEDVDALADPSGRARQTTRRSGAPRSQEPKLQHRSIKRLVRELGESQKTLLVGLTHGQLLDKDVREILNLGDDNKAMAGVLASISKRAKSAGLDPATIITRTSQRDPHTRTRVYAYSLVPEALEEVKAGLNIT